MIELDDFDVDAARSNIYILVGSVFVLDFVAIRGAFLDPDRQAVHCISECLTLAQMASGSFDFARATALVALGLELLHHAWSDLLSSDDRARATTVRTGGHIILVICPATSAMGTDYVSIVLNLLTLVDVCC